MELQHSPRVAVVGGGSWATAIAKIITDNNNNLGWFMRSEETIESFKELKHNPRYLCGVEFDLEKLSFTSDINEIIEQSDVIVFAIPSAFIKETMDKITVSLKDKIVVSAIKGIIPDENLVIGDFLHLRYQVPLDNIVVISGPCHAEEIALERLSYLTFACCDIEKASLVATLFECHYLKTIVSDDVFGTEYAAVMKNVFAIAAGICHGLHYGDNFQAVLISNASQEMKRFIDTVRPMDRDVKSSAYLGDLLVTAYSQFSRNRTFGTLIGKGYSVKAVQAEMLMVAEGYYGVRGIMALNKEFGISLPITEAVYNILYNNKRASKEIVKLTDELK
ncbi:MAG: NAD(P)H-dependent glycerol-3-phosphate dehydrogenase [Marinifilaceae bacterium]